MVEAAGVVAIVPMKPLAEGKSRLARRLSAQERAALSLGMLRRVLVAVLSAGVAQEIWVVGGDQRVSALAQRYGALWIQDPGHDLNDTLTKAIERVFSQGKAALYVAGDLPFVKTADIHGMFRASPRLKNITLAPSRQDGGTNSMLLPAGVAFRPEMGERSFTKHIAQAGRLGISVAFCYSSGLAMDLDTVDDLDAYQHMEPGLLERLTEEAAAEP